MFLLIMKSYLFLHMTFLRPVSKSLSYPRVNPLQVHIASRRCEGWRRDLVRDERLTAMGLSDMVRARVRAEPQLPALAPLCTRTPTMPGVCCAGELRRRPAMWHCRHAKPASTLRHGTHVATPCLRRRADVCLLQPTNYWKNAQQNGMPFSLNPAIIYRGAPPPQQAPARPSPLGIRGVPTGRHHRQHHEQRLLCDEPVLPQRHCEEAYARSAVARVALAV